MKVKIKSCWLPDYWYINKIGSVHEVESIEQMWYRVPAKSGIGTCYIRIDDCEVVTEPKPLDPMAQYYKSMLDADIARWENSYTYTNANTGRIYDGHGNFLGMSEEPPIGLRPANIAARDRMFEILTAMNNYTDASKKVPQAWVDEYMKLNKFMGE